MLEQKGFLMEELTCYKSMLPKNYQCQWPAFFQQWFQWWPELDTALPGISSGTKLTDEQQLCQWFHWHAGTRKNQAVNQKTYQVVNKLLKPKSYVNKDWEIYAKVYYHSHVKSEIEGSTTTNISSLCQKIKDAFKLELEEIQEEIFCMKDEQVAAATTARDGGKDDVDPQDDISTHWA
ncbi:hypothetical protein V8B97DRAFT_2002717 [Scleroderma yunnanense]